jgi:hypothetical protein
VREREEVQEMLRILILIAALAPLHLPGAIWPERFGVFTRSSVKPAAVADRAVWDEYGMEEASQAEYTSGARTFTAVAYRLKDSTGALAAFQWQRPAGAAPSRITPLAVENQNSVLFAFHNYLFRLEGRKPEAAELIPVYKQLPRLNQSSLPVLPGYLPAGNLVPNSERYVLGPASLKEFEPRIPPSVAAFYLGTEAQLAMFRTPGGETGLAIFSFPTPNFARERAAEFSKIPGAMVKRSGPLLAVVLAPPNRDEAEILLSKVRYQATVTWDEYVPTARDNIGNLVINIFTLTGVLLLFCATAGLVFGGLKVFARRYLKRWVGDDDMIRLRLDDR